MWYYVGEVTLFPTLEKKTLKTPTGNQGLKKTLITQIYIQCFNQNA